jgi:hypothetical protein
MDGHTDRRMDRRTEMTKLIIAFRNFATAPKNETKTFKRRHNSPNFVLYISGFPQKMEESNRQDNPRAVLEVVMGSKKNCCL